MKLHPLRAMIFSLPLATMPLQAAAAVGTSIPSLIQRQLSTTAGGEFATYYAYGNGPLWIAADGSLNPAAEILLQLVRTAREDGLDPAPFDIDSVEVTIRRADRERTTGALAEAELLLSRTFVAYVSALRRPGDKSMTYEHEMLEPHPAGAYFTLADAAKAPPLDEYIRDMRWMHPLYAPLRRAIDAVGTSATDRTQAMDSLARIRNIPAQPNGRHIVVDTAKARLWMYEGNHAVGSMRVIVGKPELQTPDMAGYVRSAILNPYWNVPQNLVRKTIARNVLSQGIKYLKARGYEVLSGWNEDAILVDPATINWRAIEAGQAELHIRQRPGLSNAMGKVKYEFPNSLGIYLHDTPEKQLLLKDDRHLSNGCVRLEDAEKLGRWLMSEPVVSGSNEPERRINLPKPVPVYITYLTATEEGGRIVAGSDPYHRSTIKLASLHPIAY